MFQDLIDCGHEKIIYCSEPDAGLKAIIAIHNTVLGPAFGGCRVRKYERDEDALAEVLRLSRAMTYKTAAANLGVGGGKSVIIADPATEKTPELLVAFAKCVDSLGGMYCTAPDVGMTVPDLNLIYSHTKYVNGCDASPHGLGDPSIPTARGAFLGVLAGAEIRLDRKDLEGVKIAVQGVGNVGIQLVEMLVKSGAKVTVSDVAKERISIAAEKFGVQVAEPDAIYDADCDVFVPAGLGGTINKDTIPRLKAKLVVGPANNQLLDEKADALLLAGRDIYFIPDFIVSCGGVTMGTCEFKQIPYDEAFKMIDIVTPNVFEIDGIAKKKNITTTEAAMEMAWNRVLAAKKPVKGGK